MPDSRFPVVLSEVENLNVYWRQLLFLTKHMITEKFSVGGQYFTAGSKIVDDLGGDSLDLIEVLILLQKKTRVRINERVPFNYVLEIVDYLYFYRTRKNK